MTYATQATTAYIQSSDSGTSPLTVIEGTALTGKDRFQQVEQILEQAKECQERAKRLEQVAKEQGELADREIQEALSQQAWEDNHQAEVEAAALQAAEEGLARLGLQEAPLQARCNRLDKTRHQDRQVRFLLPTGP